MLEHQVQLKQADRDYHDANMRRFIEQGGSVHVVRPDVFGNADMALSDGRRPESFPTTKREKSK